MSKVTIRSAYRPGKSSTNVIVTPGDLSEQTWLTRKVEVLVESVLPHVHFQPGALLELVLQVDERGHALRERHVVVDYRHVYTSASGDPPGRSLRRTPSRKGWMN